MMNGGLAHVGSCGVTIEMRSATSWRAFNKSVPGSNSSTICEYCGTDFDRIRSRPGAPLSASSSGTVTSSSTSPAVRPSDGVCTSTFGGANSGKTSTCELGSCNAPTTINATAKATTRNLNFRLERTMELNIWEPSRLCHG